MHQARIVVLFGRPVLETYQDLCRNDEDVSITAIKLFEVPISGGKLHCFPQEVYL